MYIRHQICRHRTYVDGDEGEEDISKYGNNKATDVWRNRDSRCDSVVRYVTRDLKICYLST